MAELRRGARTANRQRSSGQGRPPPRKPPLRGWRLWLKRLFVWGGAFAALLILAIGTAVFFAERSLPSYTTLMNSQVGQTIVVRARDGSEIVALGRACGFTYIAVDLAGYRTGAMNESVVQLKRR